MTRILLSLEPEIERDTKPTSTVANIPNFVAFFAASLFSSGNCIPHSVISKPGETEFTRILGEQMTARALLRWIAAAFVTEYGKLLPLGLTPATLAVVMKAPSVPSRWGLAAWSRKRWALTL